MQVQERAVEEISECGRRSEQNPQEMCFYKLSIHFL